MFCEITISLNSQKQESEGGDKKPIISEGEYYFDKDQEWLESIHKHWKYIHLVNESELYVFQLTNIFYIPNTLILFCYKYLIVT